MTSRRRILTGLGALAVLAGVVGWWVVGPCTKALVVWGLRTAACPDGTPRVVANASWSAPDRNGPGTLQLHVEADFVDPRWDERTRRGLNRYDASVRLDDHDAPMSCDLDHGGGGWGSCELTLPPLTDGDHALHVTIDTPLDDVELSLDLPLYEPARVHVLTDRPLYEGGQTVRFRALALADDGLRPLPDRPGRFKVFDPSRQLVLDEDANTGPWGVAASSLPLAPEPREGTWTVRYETGDELAEAQVVVAPFELPSFTVDAAADAAWYGPGDTVRLTGQVIYTSGAPVAQARVVARWSTVGAWPPPNAWTEPQEVISGADGRFELALGEVPLDLQGRVTMSAVLQVTDPAGETAQGAGRAVLSADPIRVDAVSELSEGLVSGYPNRVYLRASTPDGRPLANRDLMVKRAWDPRDPGEVARTDASGVAELVLDPGEPVTVVIPPKPYRAPPRSEQVAFSLTETTEHVAARQLAVQERRRLEELTVRLHERCAPLVLRSENVTLLLSVKGGRISEAVGRVDPVGRCMSASLVGQPLGSGRRELAVSWSLRSQNVPRLALERSFGAPDFDGLLQDATAYATHCAVEGGPVWRSVSPVTGRTELPWTLRLASTPGRADVAVELLPRDGEAVPSCLTRTFAGLHLDEAAERREIALFDLVLVPPTSNEGVRPQATTRLGYELVVGMDEVGETRLNLWPGEVPPLRLRPSKVVLEPGEALAVKLLRGPSYTGGLPDTLYVRHAGAVIAEIEREDTASDVDVSLPEAVEGFVVLEAGGAQSIVYVQPVASLEMELAWEGEERPGAAGSVTVHTSSQAVVSLVGVDRTLQALAPLTAADELARQQVAASSSSPAFGSLDAVALAMGTIEGVNAARAAVLRVDDAGAPEARSTRIESSGQTAYLPDAEIFEAFFQVLATVRQGVRAWEASADGAELLTNERLEGLWNEAVREGDVRDPWDRPLALATLPEDLLGRLDPRVLAADATRLPEDVVDWVSWARWRKP